MGSPIVSVVIPSYNAGLYIRETLLSVLAQTVTDFEIIVVDDGSTDNQKSVILEVAKNDERIKYFYINNQGVSAARNFGYEKTKGQFIAFLDADDVWLEDNLDEKLKKFKSGDFGLVHSDAHLIDEFSVNADKTLQGNEGDLLELMLTWESTQVPGPSSVLVKRTVLDSIGLFDTNLSTSADHDFFLRVASKYRIGRVPKITWMYRIHCNNMHKNVALMEHDILYVYKKAEQSGFFLSKRFRNKCFSTMYLILAASWAGDGKNKWKGLLFVLRAIWFDPLAVRKLFRRVLKSVNRG